MNDSLVTSYPLAVDPLVKGRIAAIADADQRRPIILVLGMHRSGTSLCAHVLSAMGIDMADRIGAAPSNAAGHWERDEIVEFHDRIFALLNRGYFTPLHDFPLPAAWWADPRVCQIRSEIVAFLEKRMGHRDFGFKDPRTLRLMPMWHQILDDLKLTPKIVLCLRNPTQVARSLKIRDGLDLETGEYRWLTHMVDFFRYSSSFDICAVEYEDWFHDPLANFEKLRTFLGVQWRQSEPDLHSTLSGIIDPTLRHDGASDVESRQPLVRTLHKLARSGAATRGNREQVNEIVSQFVAFQRLQEPFHRAFERLAAKVPQLEQEAAQLQACLADAASEAEAQRASLVEITAARDVHAAASQEQRAELEGTRTEIVAEREAHAVALHELRAELGSTRATLTDVQGSAQAAETRAGESEARLVVALAEGETQRTQIEAICGQRDNIASTLSATREALAASREAAEAAIKAETADLRNALTRAELATAEALRNATDEAERYQQQLAALNHQLAVSREVGRAALAALKNETAILPEALHSVGRLMPVLRFFGFRKRSPRPVADHYQT